MPASRPVFLDEAGCLQCVLQKAVRHGDAVLPPRDLVKVPDIESPILLAIELQQSLDFRRRDAADRW
jgi:hypothetical protein